MCVFAVFLAPSLQKRYAPLHFLHNLCRMPRGQRVVSFIPPVLLTLLRLVRGDFKRLWEERGLVIWSEPLGIFHPHQLCHRLHS